MMICENPDFCTSAKVNRRLPSSACGRRKQMFRFSQITSAVGVEAGASGTPDQPGQELADTIDQDLTARDSHAPIAAVEIDAAASFGQDGPASRLIAIPR